MRKYITILALAGFVFSSCNQPSDSENTIDYNELDELPVELEHEISETENFLPANLSDLFVDSEGNILVADVGSNTIEQFDAEGNYIATVAEEGGGPGELDQYFNMYGLGPDTLAVRQQSMERAYFAQNEEGIYEYVRSHNPGEQRDRLRSLSVVGAHTDTSFFAEIRHSYSDIQEARKNNTDYRENAGVIVTSNHEVVEDSVHMLKKPVGHISEINGGFMVNTIPYRGSDKLVALDENRYLLARPDSSAFFVYNADHEQEKRIPFSVEERPVTSEDIDYAFRNMESEIPAEVEDRIFDEKPPYLDVWATDEYILLHTDNTKEGKQMVAVGLDGNPRGAFWLDEDDDIQHVEDSHLYTLHQDSEAGHTIRRYEIDL